MALGREEGEHHAAADEEPVDARQEVLDDAELVADLRSAEHDRVGTLGLLGEAVEDLDLLLDEEAGSRRQDLGEVVDARLLAVHDAEAVRHERVAELSELRGERAALRVVLRRLARVEPEVLDDRDVAVLEGRDRLVGGLAHGVARERDRLAEQLRQSLCDRLEAVLRVGRAVGAAEVRADDDAGALVDEGVERGERCPHTAIVRDDRRPSGGRSGHNGR